MGFASWGKLFVVIQYYKWYLDLWVTWIIRVLDYTQTFLRNFDLVNRQCLGIFGCKKLINYFHSIQRQLSSKATVYKGNKLQTMSSCKSWPLLQKLQKLTSCKRDLVQRDFHSTNFVHFNALGKLFFSFTTEASLRCKCRIEGMPLHCSCCAEWLWQQVGGTAYMECHGALHGCSPFPSEYHCLWPIISIYVWFLPDF